MTHYSKWLHYKLGESRLTKCRERAYCPTRGATALIPSHASLIDARTARLTRVRSPLLPGSRLIFFPLGTKLFQFPRYSHLVSRRSVVSQPDSPRMLPAELGDRHLAYPPARVHWLIIPSDPFVKLCFTFQIGADIINKNR
jgi:hypothetical protein